MTIINLKLEGEQLELFINVLKQNIDQQKTEIEQIEQELEDRRRKMNSSIGHLDSLIIQLSNASNDEYSSGWTLIQKVKYVLKIEGAPLSVRDIFEKLKKFEPGVQGDKPDQAFKTGIAASLGNYAKDKQFFYKDDSGPTNKYGLLEE